jgi:hypothetical protein
MVDDHREKRASEDEFLDTSERQEINDDNDDADDDSQALLEVPIALFSTFPIYPFSCVVWVPAAACEQFTPCLTSAWRAHSCRTLRQWTSW